MHIIDPESGVRIVEHDGAKTVCREFESPQPHQKKIVGHQF